MTDREKVIKGLEICIENINQVDCPNNCPYYSDCTKYESRYVFQPLLRDTLKLIKQKLIAPFTKLKESDFRSELVEVDCCGNCGHELDRYPKKWNFCPECGQAVKRE